LKETERRIRTALTPLVLALELSAETVVGALVDERARVLVERRRPLAQKTPRAAAAAVTALLLELASRPERQAGEIKAVGLSVPGAVEPQSGRISAPALDWRRVSLLPQIERGLEQSGTDIRTPASAQHSKAMRASSAHPPTIIVSPRAAFAAAEAWAGVARGKRHVVGLLIGREIAAGIMSEGRVLHGAGGWAGAVGWLAQGETSRGEYARDGCLTVEANDASLVRRTIESWTSDADSALGRLASSDPAALTPAAVIRAAQGGDPLAARVVGDACRRIGRAVADLISLLNPEAVVLGGELGVALRPFINDIRREARQWAQPDAARQCRIVGGRLGRKAGLLGTARLAWLQAGSATSAP
jgi:glucokinase